MRWKVSGVRTGSSSSRRLRALALALAAVAAVLGSPSPATGSTWYITPTTINETNSSLNACEQGPSCIEAGASDVVDGTPVTGLQSSLPASQYPTAENTNQWEFTAPNLDYGADAWVDYAMPNGDQFGTYTQDDIGNLVDNGFHGAPAAFCIAAWPADAYEYSCAATLGTSWLQETWPDAAHFAPYYNFRENNVDAPPGSRMATVAAAGQSCAAEMAPGDSVSCKNQRPKQGFSPVDPGNYQSLTFINRGSTPVTMTDTAPNDCYDLHGDPGDCSGSCTMPGWGTTCTLMTSGEETQSDDFRISPGPGAPEGDNWYGIMIAVQGELPEWLVEGNDSDFWLNFILTGINVASENGFAAPPLWEEAELADGASPAQPRVEGLRLEQLAVGDAAAGAQQAVPLPPLPEWVRYAANVRYSINFRVPVTFTVERRRHGVRWRGRCVAPRPGRRLGQRWIAAVRGPRCVRWQPMPGKFVSADGNRGGRYGWRFSGRLPGQRALPAGRYRMIAQVRGPRRTSVPKRAGFTIPARTGRSR